MFGMLQFLLSIHSSKMKLLLLLALPCLFAAASAQVHCLNPGSVEIPPAICCGQMPQAGLAGALVEFFNLMDLECKVNLFFDRVITDPDVTAFFNYITGPEFRVLILSIQEMPEFVDLMTYLCKELDLDFFLYLNTLGDIMGIPRVPHIEGPYCHPEFPFPFIGQKSHPISHRRSPRDTNHQSGVRRLFDDLGAEMPNDKMYDMWLYKVANDPYLCPGFLKLSGPDFRAIALKVEYHPEFLRFVQKMEDWGMYMQWMIDTLKEFLWYSDYCR